MKLFAVVFAAISVALPGSALVTGERPTPEQEFNIHPNGDNNKCVSVSNDVLAVGSPVTIFDCNGSLSQKWAWWGDEDQSALFVTNPVNKKRLCINVADRYNFENGAKLLLTDCLSEGTWTHPEELFMKPYPWRESWGYDYAPDIYFSILMDSGRSSCLDLTDGSKENGNVLQLWECASDRANNTSQNQIWTLTTV